VIPEHYSSARVTAYERAGGIPPGAWPLRQDGLSGPPGLQTNGYRG
jgi:hypothetical protein